MTDIEHLVQSYRLTQRLLAGPYSGILIVFAREITLKYETTQHIKILSLALTKITSNIKVRKSDELLVAVANSNSNSVLVSQSIIIWKTFSVCILSEILVRRRIPVPGPRVNLFTNNPNLGRELSHCSQREVGVSGGEEVSVYL